MGTVKRAGDSDSSERQQRLNDSKTDYKKAKMGSSNSWNDRDRLYTTREPGTHEALDSTSLGEREKHRSDASVHLHIDLFSNFDQNGTLVEQGDKERKVEYLTFDIKAEILTSSLPRLSSQQSRTRTTRTTLQPLPKPTYPATKHPKRPPMRKATQPPMREQTLARRISKPPRKRS